MSKSPIIKNFNSRGGTFYAFSSAENDFGKAKNNVNVDVKFSNFVCLNIPKFKRLTSAPYHNYMQLDTIDGTLWEGGLSGDGNKDLSQSFQNYVLNFENSVLNDNYDNTIDRTVSERVFFKWLKETGAIRFRNSTEAESTDTSKFFTEEDNKSESLIDSNPYSRVVKYIGNIDIENSVIKGGENYTELYLRIPTQVGNTPTILFESISDSNYKKNKSFICDSDFLNGYDNTFTHPDSLSMHGYFDYDSNVEYTDPNANWHNGENGEEHVYYTDPVFDIPSNTVISKYYNDYNVGSDVIKLLRTSLDGISISFDSSAYNQIQLNSSINSIQEYNSTDAASDFNFNAILIYYDKIENDVVVATNLFGILFVDKVLNSADGHFINVITKNKPNKVTGLNGNSYGLSLNMKDNFFDTESGLFTIINEYNNFSMGLFSEAIVKLQESSKLFSDQILEMIDVKSRISELENLIQNVKNIYSLNEKISELEKNLENSQLALASNSSILDLIASNSDEIQKLANGKLSENLTYNTDVLQSGQGIEINNSQTNKLFLNNTVPGYNLNIIKDENDIIINSDNEYDINVSIPKIYTELKYFTNQARINVKNSALNNVNIYINDSTIKFKNGQILRIVFPKTLNLNGFSLKIFSDKLNTFGNGEYGVILAEIPDNDLSSNPIIEIICINSSTYTFEYDILK